MVIYEHVKGILSVPCYLDDGDYAGYTTDIALPILILSGIAVPSNPLPVTAAPFPLAASARRNCPFSCT